MKTKAAKPATKKLTSHTPANNLGKFLHTKKTPDKAPAKPARASVPKTR